MLYRDRRCTVCIFTTFFDIFSLKQGCDESRCEVISCTDRINCWSELKRLEALTQGEITDFDTLADIVRLAARLEMCFNELRSFNNTGKFLGKLPFISSRDERSRIFDILRRNPEEYFQERKNVELNISRYSSQVNSPKLAGEKKEKAKTNLEKFQALLQVFKDVFDEFVKGK